MKTVLNEYKVTFANGTEKTCVVRTLSEAAENNETVENPLFQITRTRTNIDTFLPDPIVDVQFETSVTPSAAVTGGCIATPTEYETTSGKSVIFQAIAADGFNFTGWYLNGTKIADNAISEIEVNAPQETEQPVIYEARFAPAA